MSLEVIVLIIGITFLNWGLINWFNKAGLGFKCYLGFITFVVLVGLGIWKFIEIIFSLTK